MPLYAFNIITERYVVLVDTMLNPEMAATQLGFAEPFLASRQLLVFNTHYDWDHVWGNQLFVGEDATHPAPIIASKLTDEKLREPEGASYLAEMQEKNDGLFDEVCITYPTMLFDELLTIYGGDLTLNIFPTPGHTADHMSIYIPEIETLIAADAAETPFPYAREVSGLPIMRQSLQTLADYNAKTVLYCHDDFTDSSLIHQNIAYFDGVDAAVSTSIQNGVTLPEDESADLGTLINHPPPSPDDAKGHNFQIRQMWQYKLANS